MVSVTPASVILEVKVTFPFAVALPEIVGVAAPEKLRLLNAWLAVVSVGELPSSASVFPVSVVSVQLVRSTFPDAVQVPAPVVIAFPVPAEQVRLPVTFTVGLFALPVSVTSLAFPDSATSRFPENVTV
jgi:hypothetical protein